MIRKVVGWGVVIGAIYYLVSDPGGAAGMVHAVLSGLADGGRSLARFVASL